MRGEGNRVTGDMEDHTLHLSGQPGPVLTTVN